MFAIREERLLTIHTSSLKVSRSKDRVRLCRLSTSFQECLHMKLFFDIRDKNYKKDERRERLDEKL